MLRLKTTRAWVYWDDSLSQNAVHVETCLARTGHCRPRQALKALGPRLVSSRLQWVRGLRAPPVSCAVPFNLAPFSVCQLRHAPWSMLGTLPRGGVLPVASQSTAFAAFTGRPRLEECGEAIVSSPTLPPCNFAHSASLLGLRRLFRHRAPLHIRHS